MRRAVRERERALDAGLSRRYGEVDELARPEQAEVAIRRGERVPFEPGLGDENFALVETGSPGGGANLIAGLDCEQRLVAVDDVERGKAFGEVRGEPVGANLHGGLDCWSDKLGRRTRRRSRRFFGGLQTA